MTIDQQVKDGDLVPFKQWKMDLADKLGITLCALEMRLCVGTLAYPTTLRLNKRVIYVKVKPDNALTEAVTP